MSSIRVMLFVAVTALTIGILVGIVFFVFGSLYIIPYSCWLGCQMAEGRYLDQKDIGLGKSFRYASKLYKHWIFRKELDF